MRISDWSSYVCSSDLWLLDQAGIDVPSGPLTVAAVQGNAASGGGRWSLSGTASRVPWGARARLGAVAAHGDCARIFLLHQATVRSEERRVGKEGVRTCRSRGSPQH